MLAEKSEPKCPQSVGALQHDLHQPTGVGFAMIGERQLQDMFEIACQHRKAAAMRQPVGKERDQRSADDREQAETGPGNEQQPESRPVGGFGIRLRASEHIDDTAEKHRLSE